MSTIEKTETRPYDAAEYLDNPEVIAHYLAFAASDPDPRMLNMALSNVAKAVGITNLAERTGLGRESLYKTIAIDAQPRLDTIRRIAAALGVTLSFAPQAKVTKAKPAKKAAAKVVKVARAPVRLTKTKGKKSRAFKATGPETARKRSA